MTDTLIVNALLVNDGKSFHGDLRIRGERIEAIAPSLSARAGETVIDAAGKWLLPGVIDSQVHFREPGMEYKGGLDTEPAAAVAGGVTSFLDMPNTKPPTLDGGALEAKYALAAGRSRANYGFYHGASNDNLDAIRRIDPKTTPGLKIFMGASTGNMLVDDPVVLEAMFRDCPTPIITHCEDTPMIEAAMAAARTKYGDDIPVDQHPLIRSREACMKSTVLARTLAQRCGTSLHVLHITSAEEIALFEAGPLIAANGRRKQITAETCVHFLHFARDDYGRLGNLIKCNPAVKESSDRSALLRAIADDRVDVLATDHAPHTWDEKQQPYATAPSGLPLVQDFLVCALQKVADGHFTLEKLVQKICHAPAQRFDIAERGFLREGFFADLTLVDPHGGTVATRERVLARCGWTPFEGERFDTRVAATYVNGILAFDGDRVVGSPQGQRLRFAR